MFQPNARCKLHWWQIMHLIHIFILSFFLPCTLKWIVWIEKGCLQKIYVPWMREFCSLFNLTVPRAQRQISARNDYAHRPEEVHHHFLYSNWFESWAQQIKRNEWTCCCCLDYCAAVPCRNFFIALSMNKEKFETARFMPCFSSTAKYLQFFCMVTTHIRDWTFC